MSTIVEVAKLASVSTATVSNVIRGTRKVSEARTRKVHAAIRELNYSPNEIARSLKVKQTRMLVVVLPDITNPFFPEIIRGAEDAAFSRGYFLLTANTNEQQDRERRIVTALRSYRVDGILLATTESWNTHGSSEISGLVYSGIPIVCLDRTVHEVPTDAVLLDNQGGAQACLQHLIDQGHRRIGMITGPLHLQTALERLEGYKRALEENGISLRKNLIVEGDYRFESGRKQTAVLMGLRSKPTAIFVSNGRMATGSMRALEQLHLHCPEDVAVATFDSAVDQAGHPLTCVAQPSYDMGFRAATILTDRIEGRLPKDLVVVRVSPNLVLGDSTNRKMRGSRLSRRGESKDSQRVSASKLQPAK